MDNTEIRPATTARVPLAHLVPSGTHVQAVRRARYSQDSLRELADSIRTSGVLQPILARHAAASTFGSARYEIVAGERRWRAAEMAGLAEIDVTVRDLSDRDVLEAQLVENLQREGLDPLSEAEGYAELMQVSELDAEGVGKMIGKSRSYVYSRTKLLDLIPAGREALAAGKLDASRALLVARLVDEKAQAKALELALQLDWAGERPAHSYRTLLAEIGKKKATVDLSGAPFALDDASLPGGACTECPKRSGACPVAGVKEDVDVCLDPVCHKTKLRAVGQLNLQRAQESGLPVISGDEAKRITSTGAMRDRLVGYVDLDATCYDDEYPEPEPSGDDEEAWKAWEVASREYRSRTFRQILGEDAVPTALLIHPQTGRAIEIMPAAKVTALLEQHGITPMGTIDVAQPRETGAQAHKRWEEERRAVMEKLEKERAYRLRLAQEIKPSLRTSLFQDDLARIAALLIEQIYPARTYIPALYGARPVVRSMSDLDLACFIRCCMLSIDLDGREKPALLHTMAKTCGIDPKQFRRDFEAGKLPELGADKPAEKTAPKRPAKKPAKKAAKKSKGAKS